MTSDDPDILVQRFIDGDLSEDEVQQALHRIADDAEARNLLQFELRMTQDLAASPSAALPDDFADRTMAAVAREPAPGEDGDTLGAQLRSWWAAMTAGVTLQVRPMTATVAVLLLAVGAWALWSTGPTGVQEEARRPRATASSESAAVQQTTTQVSSNGQTVWVRFLYPNSEADSVAVAGDFSQWEPVPLSPRTVDGETVWTGLVPVSRGEHEYQFLINGDRWVPDPLAPVTRSDGFGAKNAVLNV
jgi:negative regulator of sigma E activity